MREQGLFILNLIVIEKLLPLQFIQTKELYSYVVLCHTQSKSNDNRATKIYYTGTHIAHYSLTNTNILIK